MTGFGKDDGSRGLAVMPVAPHIRMTHMRMLNGFHMLYTDHFSNSTAVHQFAELHKIRGIAQHMTDGILLVKAKELRSGTEQSIEVKPQYGLTDEDVERMLLDSMTHAKEDMETRALTEAKTEAEQLLQTTEKFIQRNFRELTGKEISATSLAMQALQLSLDMNDKNLIQAKTEELNDVSRPYAERLMDEAIQKTMKGNKIDQV